MDTNDKIRLYEIESRGKRRRLEMAYKRAATQFNATRDEKSRGYLQGLASALEIVYDVERVYLDSLMNTHHLRKNIVIKEA